MKKEMKIVLEQSYMGDEIINYIESLEQKLLMACVTMEMMKKKLDEMEDKK